MRQGSAEFPGLILRACMQAWMDRLREGVGVESLVSGRGEAWYRVRFGAERSPVQIRPPRYPHIFRTPARRRESP